MSRPLFASLMASVILHSCLLVLLSGRTAGSESGNGGDRRQLLVTFLRLDNRVERLSTASSLPGNQVGVRGLEYEVSHSQPPQSRGGSGSPDFAEGSGGLGEADWREGPGLGVADLDEPPELLWVPPLDSIDMLASTKYERVELRVQVSAEGVVDRVDAVTGSDVFAIHAKGAFSQAKFRPGRLKGVPVPSEVYFEIVYPAVR